MSDWRREPMNKTVFKVKQVTWRDQCCALYGEISKEHENMACAWSDLPCTLTESSPRSVRRTWHVETSRGFERSSSLTRTWKVTWSGSPRLRTSTQRTTHPSWVSTFWVHVHPNRGICLLYHLSAVTEWPCFPWYRVGYVVSGGLRQDDSHFYHYQSLVSLCNIIHDIKWNQEMFMLVRHGNNCCNNNFRFLHLIKNMQFWEDTFVYLVEASEVMVLFI